MSPTATTTDRIEKQKLIRAPRARVWRALVQAEELGRWFGARIPAGSLTAGARIRGPITHKGYEHVMFDVVIERVEPERLIAWRWHPNAVDAGRDYADEPTTLVVFELTDAPDGTMLTVTETGFDRIPAERRDAAYRGNDGGWSSQVIAIDRYVTSS